MRSDNPLHWSNIDNKHRKLIMTGLMLGILAVCLDSTIVSTCGTVIARDLNGLGLFSWMFTAYMLCETITIPIGGKLSDLYGRKPFFLIGIVLFAGGSIVAGLSVNMEMLITCRAVQGIGGGLIMPVATAAIADLYAPAERGKMQGLLGAVFGLGTALGPVLGGLIADVAGWQWIFYINVPLAAAVLFLIARQFPPMEVANTKRIDYMGMSVLGLLLLDILLFFTWAGNEFEWMGYESALMIGVAVLLLALFIFLERRAEDPVLSPHLFKNRTFVGGAFSMLIFGLALMGSMTYLSMFSIYVMDLSVREAGYLTIAMVAGLMITASLSGKLLQRTGYRPWLIAGPIVSCIAMTLMSTIGLGDSVWLLAFYMFILGMGLGCVMAILMVAVQNSAKPEEMGMTTSGVNLFRAIGGTVATALFSFLINLRLDDSLKANLPSDVYAAVPHNTDVLAYLTNLPQYANQILTSFADSVNFAFLIGGTIILLMLVSVFLIKGEVSNVQDGPKDLEGKKTEEPKDLKEEAPQTIG